MYAVTSACLEKVASLFNRFEVVDIKCYEVYAVWDVVTCVMSRFLSWNVFKVNGTRFFINVNGF